METYLGTVLMFAGNFAPRGWALCNGQLLSIAQNSALFSLLGTTYGGDGITTFALPNLQGRAPIHWGQSPGLTNRVIGEASGSENVTLINTQMPQHTHTVSASAATGTQASPEGNVLALSSDPDVGGAPLNFIAPASINTTMAPAMISTAGNSQPHNNMQPYLAITFIIALEGIYPSRN
ncbi:tail fiber protein [Mucilaginibacter sabulilitoris]|uniref:Tail fiber protein n=1 Tax=Mucilaginibacter sabulilitoris TaxID=1173583 RepID=A0ABZ0TYW7_9SPHI|nr:tail fiber protein [Mucilaginibacter sabulilitoris]WPU97009.1 tail fiber protein [Mucilaginibacter sabulilitoris]